MLIKTQVALTVIENLLRILFLTSLKRENILSGSAFKFGSDRTAFKRFVKFGYLVTLFGRKIFFTYHQNLI